MYPMRLQGLFCSRNSCRGHGEELSVLVEMGSGRCTVARGTAMLGGRCGELGLQWSCAPVCPSAGASPCKSGSMHHTGLPPCPELRPGSQPAARCSWPHEISTQRLHLFSDSAAFVPVFRTFEREHLSVVKIKAQVPHPVAAHSQPRSHCSPFPEESDLDNDIPDCCS